MTARLNIICKAVVIRMNNGEELEDILLSYPALSEEDRAAVRDYVNA